MGTNMADGNQQSICYRVLVQKRELILEELINIKVILFLIHELFRWQNSPKYVTFLTYMTALSAVTKKLRNSSVLSIRKPRTLLKKKFV